MKQEHKRLLTDPRLVTVKHNGEDLHFWYHRRGALLAEKHGYTGNLDEDVDGATLDTFGDRLLRFMWVCHLPFNEDMTFEEFDFMFLPSDYAKLGTACADIVTRQLPRSDNKDEDAPKKARGRAKKK
jgi:hypothetical protein